MSGVREAARRATLLLLAEGLDSAERTRARGADPRTVHLLLALGAHAQGRAEEAREHWRRARDAQARRADDPLQTHLLEEASGVFGRRG